MQPNQTKPNHIYLIYMYKEDLALNNLQRLICHKTQTKLTDSWLSYSQPIDLNSHWVHNTFGWQTIVSEFDSPRVLYISSHVPN